MGLKNDLIKMVESTTEIIVYAANNIPESRFHTPPPHGEHPNADKGFKTYFGSWSASRLLYHLVHYERSTTIPTMRVWLAHYEDRKTAAFDHPEAEDRAYDRNIDEEVTKQVLVNEFIDLRSQQVGILRQVPETNIQKELETDVFGNISLLFVVSKTIQHSLEHGNDIMKNALNWDRALEWLDSQQEE